MKFVCSRDELLQAINTVQKAITSKSTLPILEGILVVCEKSVKLTGNDLELAIEHTIEADVFEPGSIVINSKIFGEIIRKLPNSEISIKVTDDLSVHIDCTYSHFKIKGISPQGYPSIPLVDEITPYIINQNILRDMMKQTMFSVSTDENRKTLMGALIESNNGLLNLVSIDGFRMSIRNYSCENSKEKFKAIVPGKTLNEIVKILDVTEQPIHIYVNKSLMLIKLRNCSIVSRLIEGEFMNYKAILPVEFGTKITVQTRELLGSIERASLITEDDKKYPVLFNILANELVISSCTQLGNVNEHLPAEISGNAIEIGFNPRYFIDALRTIENEKIDVLFTTTVGPCTIKSIDDDSFTYLILPVRTKSDDEYEK